MPKKKRQVKKQPKPAPEASPAPEPTAKAKKRRPRRRKRTPKAVLENMPIEELRATVLRDAQLLAALRVEFNKSVLERTEKLREMLRKAREG